MRASLIFLLSVLCIIGCRKKDDDAPAGPASPQIPELPLSGAPGFHATVNGTNMFLQHGNGNIENVPFTTLEPFIDASYTSNFYHTADELVLASVTVGGQLFAGQFPTEEEFYAYFAPGNKPYFEYPDPAGIQVYLVRNGQAYSTSSMAQPAGSSFTITHATPIGAGTDQPRVKVRATFTCQISAGAGMPLNITNGRFVGEFSKN